MWLQNCLSFLRNAADQLDSVTVKVIVVTSLWVTYDLHKVSTDCCLGVIGDCDSDDDDNNDDNDIHNSSRKHGGSEITRTLIV